MKKKIGNPFKGISKFISRCIKASFGDLDKEAIKKINSATGVLIIGILYALVAPITYTLFNLGLDLIWIVALSAIFTLVIYYLITLIQTVFKVRQEDLDNLHSAKAISDTVSPTDKEADDKGDEISPDLLNRLATMINAAVANAIEEQIAKYASVPAPTVSIEPDTPADRE